MNAKLPADRYVQSGMPLAEQAWPKSPWGAEKEGLSAGIRIIGDARIGGEVKSESWVQNSGAKDVTCSQSPRADVGLYVVANDKDGKEHSAVTLLGMVLSQATEVPDISGQWTGEEWGTVVLEANKPGQ